MPLSLVLTNISVTDIPEWKNESTLILNGQMPGLEDQLEELGKNISFKILLEIQSSLYRTDEETKSNLGSVFAAVLLIVLILGAFVNYTKYRLDVQEIEDESENLHSLETSPNTR